MNMLHNSTSEQRQTAPILSPMEELKRSTPLLYKIFNTYLHKLCKTREHGTDQTESKAAFCGIKSQDEFSKCVRINSQYVSAAGSNQSELVGQSPAHKTWSEAIPPPSAHWHVYYCAVSCRGCVSGC